MKGAALHPGILGLLAIGLLCGWLAQQIGTPLPYLLGSLLGVGATVIIAGNHMPDGVTFPQNIRAAFVVVIGVMIGGAFNPSIFGDLPGLLLSGGLILVFVGFSFGANFLIFKKIGGYDAQTAFCAGMPGGLIESIEMAEQSGADTRIVTAQQFLRVVIVIVTLPLIFAYWTGAPVGSAAGMRIGAHSAAPVLMDWFLLSGAGIGGYLAGRALRIPAHVIIGPLLASAFVHGMGWTQAQPPGWLIILAQTVMGTGLGARFKGIGRRVLAQAFGLGLLSAASMLCINLVMAYGVNLATLHPLPVLILCFAAGGLTEMSLIALSFNANPVFVTMHHVLRILVTVIIASFAFNRLNLRNRA